MTAIVRFGDRPIDDSPGPEHALEPMHPLLARFLDLEQAARVLSRAERGDLLEGDDRLYADMARAAPEHARAVLEAKGRKHPPQEAQKGLIYLAAHAALESLRRDERFGPKLAEAASALRREGASAEEIDQMLANLVLEEAFGYEDEAAGFDRAFFDETLEHLPELAKVTRGRVDEWLASFAKTAEPDWRSAYENAARTLLEVAWGEGLEPINPEHVQVALEELSGRPDAERAAVALKRFLSFLREQRLIGPLRLKRLERAVDISWAEDGRIEHEH